MLTDTWSAGVKVRLYDTVRIAKTKNLVHDAIFHVRSEKTGDSQSYRGSVDITWEVCTGENALFWMMRWNILTQSSPTKEKKPFTFEKVTESRIFDVVDQCRIASRLLNKHLGKILLKHDACVRQRLERLGMLAKVAET